MSTLILGPYETALTSLANDLGILGAFLEDISPAIITLITTNLALHKSAKEQRIMDRRIRTCKRICKSGHFLGVQITDQVEFDFQDLTLEQQTNLSKLLVFEVLGK